MIDHDQSTGPSKKRSSIFRKLDKLGLPIPQSGRSRFFVTLCIFFLIAFIYDVLRGVKLALIMSGQNTGAEIIPFIKIWAVLPGTFLLTLLFTILVRRLGIEKVFYVMVSLFLFFFLTFILFIFPNQEALELKAFGEYLQSFLPPGARGFVAMVRHWHFTLFYVFAELWGNIILNMLFWGFVNEVTAFSEAKRFYSVFALSANLAPVIAGRFCIAIRAEDWQDSLTYYIASVMVAGTVLSVLFYCLNRLHERDFSASEMPHRSLDKKEKKKKDDSLHISLKESIILVIKSSYLRSVIIMVFGYYMVYNLADILWTDQVGLRFQGDANSIGSYVNQVSSTKGMLATFMGLFVSGTVIRRFGWYVAALVTPMVLMITSALFYSCLLFKGAFWADVLVDLFASPFVHITVLIGAVQHCLVRASKYTVFDATKEMAFIPLTRRTQRMGKAVIDGIGARLGKSGGSFIFQFLLFFLGSLSATVPYIAAFTVVILIAWVYAVTNLKKEIEGKIQHTEEMSK